MKWFAFLLGTLPLLSSCGGGSGDASLSDKLGDYQLHVRELSNLAGDHRAAIETASALDGVAAEEMSYGASAGDHHAWLDHLAGEMSTCMHEAGFPDHEAMHERLDALAEELRGHALHMQEARNLEAARAEEARHQEAITQLCGALEQYHDQMVEDLDQEMPCGDQDHHHGTDGTPHDDHHDHHHGGR